MAVLKVYNGTIWIEIPTGVIDAALAGYSPAVLADWLNGLDPGEVDDALDQLADQKATVTGTNVDNAIMRADGTAGNIQDSQITLSDSGALSEVESITGETGSGLTLTTKSGNALAFNAFGGAGSATANGGLAQISGGQGGSTSGDGGAANLVAGQPPTSGNGGDCNITAADGTGTNKDGGNVNVTAGLATGSGTAGTIVLVNSTVFNEAGADVDFRIESDGDANNFVSDGGTNRIGIGMLSPNEKLQVTDAIALSNNTEGNTARLVCRTTHETHTLAAASTSDTTTISIPSGARLLGVSMNVNVEISDGFAGTWTAAFITGSSTSIETGGSKTVNFKTNFIVPDDEKTSAVTEIRFTAGTGNFSAGVIEIVAYYEVLVSLADV